VSDLIAADRIAELNQMLDDIGEQVAVLDERNAELEAQLKHPPTARAATQQAGYIKRIEELERQLRKSANRAQELGRENEILRRKLGKKAGEEP